MSLSQTGLASGLQPHVWCGPWRNKYLLIYCLFFGHPESHSPSYATLPSIKSMNQKAKVTIISARHPKTMPSQNIPTWIRIFPTVSSFPSLQ